VGAKKSDEQPLVENL